MTRRHPSQSKPPPKTSRHPTCPRRSLSLSPPRLASHQSPHAHRALTRRAARRGAASRGDDDDDAAGVPAPGAAAAAAAEPRAGVGRLRRAAAAGCGAAAERGGAGRGGAAGDGDDAPRKHRRGEPITVVTAYDYPSAVHVDSAGIDVCLVGDSAAMVVHGHDTTLPISLDVMLEHCRAVARGATRPLLVGDLPFGCYESSSTRVHAPLSSFTPSMLCRRVAD